MLVVGKRKTNHYPLSHKHKLGWVGSILRISQNASGVQTSNCDRSWIMLMNFSSRMSILFGCPNSVSQNKIVVLCDSSFRKSHLIYPCHIYIYISKTSNVCTGLSKGTMLHDKISLRKIFLLHRHPVHPGIYKHHPLVNANFFRKKKKKDLVGWKIKTSIGQVWKSVKSKQ